MEHFKQAQKNRESITQWTLRICRCRTCGDGDSTKVILYQGLSILEFWVLAAGVLEPNP